MLYFLIVIRLKLTRLTEIRNGVGGGKETRARDWEVAATGSRYEDEPALRGESNRGM